MVEQRSGVWRDFAKELRHLKHIFAPIFLNGPKFIFNLCLKSF
jgi:hypothetical protein